MGAYENPVTVIDRESGKIWANTISAIGKQTANAIEKQEAELSRQQKEQQIALEKNAEYIINNQAEFSKQMSKNGVNNPYLFDAGKVLIDDMAKATMNIKSAKGKEAQQEALNYYSTLQKSYTNLVSGIKNGADADQVFLEDISNSENRPGTQGGMSVTGKGYEAYKMRQMVRTGQGQGAVEQYVPQADGTWNVRYSGGIYGDEVVEIPQQQALNYDPGLVPNLDNELGEIFKAPSGTKDGQNFGVLTKSGAISEQYLGKKEIVNGKPNADGSYVQSIVQGVNMPAVIGAIEGPIRAKVQMYLKDRDTANVIWREILGHDEDLDFNENGVGISIEDQKLFEQEVFNRAKSKFLPNMKIENNEITSGYEKTTSSTIQNIKDKYKGKKDSKGKEVEEIAYSFVKDFTSNPEEKLLEFMDKDDFQLKTSENGSVIGVIIKGGEEFEDTIYDFNKPSSLKRFFKDPIFERYLGKNNSERISTLRAIDGLIDGPDKQDSTTADQVFDQYLSTKAK
jgi:hypothetical protein